MASDRTEQQARESNHEQLLDFDNSFANEDDITAFANALHAPDTTEEDFITALNDWKPVKQKIRRKKRKQPRRGKDETREGFVYTLLKWPLLVASMGWILILSILYLSTRLYISQYEYWITWRGKREKLRKALRSKENYPDWVEAAKTLDSYLGAESWKDSDEFAYYNYKTIRKVVNDMRELRMQAQKGVEIGRNDTIGDANGYQNPNDPGKKVAEELRILLEACVKNNFGGIESARLYSQTYYGTKSLVQEYVEEVEKCLHFLLESDCLLLEEKRAFFKHLQQNYGRAALCLSGGACFAYYHFGIAKALIDANLLPKVVTGTSGGALVAGLICTRTDEELKKLLVPELANKITACHDDISTWIRRWWKTGARFDSVDWARRCCWFTRGSMTFKEAYERTGRILNISCIPSDPHSPSLLLNHITAPDCVIWSATLASAAVPGILNPVVLMMKTKSGQLIPFSFGHKWKDGSLRTDIPLRALNLHFNVNFSIVSQVNPHVNIFFFSSRGTVGRPVTHRKGKGWRGGFLGSAVEQYLKLDLAKWLKVLRHLELLPRPMSQDWSSLWLQKFDGNITIWPKSIPSDFYYILSDPTPQRLARMLKAGQTATFPKLLFISNRLRIERLIAEGRQKTRSKDDTHNPDKPVLSTEDVQNFRQRKTMHSDKRSPASPRTVRSPLPEDGSVAENPTIDSFFDVKKREHMAATPPTPTSRFSWFSWNKGGNAPIANGDTLRFGEEQSENNLGSSTAVSPGSPPTPGTVLHRTSSISSIISASGSSRLKEIGRQGRVFFDDDTTTDDTGSESENEGGHRSGSFEEEGGRIDEDMEEEEEEDWLRSNEAEFVESAGRAVL